MTRGLCHRKGALALPLLALLAGAGSARADGFGATAEVNYTSGTLTLTDATGRSNTLDTMLVPQNYRLTLDKQLYPFLILNGYALYQWTPSWSRNDVGESESSSNRWSVFASAVIGPPILNATPYYVRRQEFATNSTGGISLRSPTLVNQSYGVYAGWSPAGLPLLSLQLGVNENFDAQRSFRDTRTEDVNVSLTYLDVENLTLRYALRYSHGNDFISGTVTDDLNQGAQVQWNSSFWERRILTSLSYTLGYRTGKIQAGSGGLVTIQQFPVGGLSLVETFPNLPSQDTLAPNAALIDGDLLAPAGIDLGFGPSLAGDQNFRDMGMVFANTTTEVNTLRLWVDQQLPPEVAAGFTFTAWRSDDNVVWTQLPLAGPVTFGIFENRFEVPIPRTQSRYLKVVTKPLSPSVTVDPRFSAIRVTELQAFLVVPADQAPSQNEQWGGNFSGSARVMLVQDWNFAYTLALAASHQDSFALQDWSVLNALGAGRNVTRDLAIFAQVSRTDSAQTNLPHEAVNRWSAQLSYNPFPTLGASFTYSGQYGQLYVGQVLSNAVTLVGNLNPWQGVSLSATAGYSWAKDEIGRSLESPNGSVSITLVPMQVLSINGTWGVSSSIAITPGGLVQSQRTTSLQGNLSFTPVRALYFNAGIIRSTGSDQGPQTLLNFGAGFSPFTGGQLLLRFGYDENLDTQAQMRNRVFGPSLRWNIRTGTYLNVAYTWNDSVQPALLTQSRSLFATLFVTLY